MFQFPVVKPDTPIRITSQFNITEKNEMIMVPNMCYVKDNLVATISHLEESTDKIKVFDETSNLVKEWASCHTFRSVMAFYDSGKGLSAGGLHDLPDDTWLRISTDRKQNSL